MKQYYCLHIKFKDQRISTKTHHAHLFVEKDDTMYMRIFIDSNQRHPGVDYKFMSLQEQSDYFNDYFEIIKTPVNINGGKIYKTTSAEYENNSCFFTIYIGEMWLVFDNQTQELMQTGKIILNKNALKIVSHFYSFFMNIEDKDVFSISRMVGRTDFYQINNMTFRPELYYSNNERRGSEEFTIKKIPGIALRFQDTDQATIINKIKAICDFLSFCFGLKIYPKKIIIYKNNQVFIFRNSMPSRKTYVSKSYYIPNKYLKKNYFIEHVLTTNWFSFYEANSEKISKAIESYLHSREVDSRSSYLLLFNVIELLKVNPNKTKFKFLPRKEKNKIFQSAFNKLKEALKNPEDSEDFQNKWRGVIGNIEYRPFKNIFQETLDEHKISMKESNFTFDDLKKTRDGLTHGYNNENEDEIVDKLISLRQISIKLILSYLGFGNDIKQ